MSSILLIVPQGTGLCHSLNDVRLLEWPAWDTSPDLGKTLAEVSEESVGIGRLRNVRWEALLAMDRESPAEPVLMPLEGYDWIPLVGGLPGRIVSLLPRISSGVLAVLPRRLAANLARCPSSADDLIRRTVRSGARLLNTVAGEPATAWPLPRLTPFGPAFDPPLLEEVRRFDPGDLASIDSAPDGVALRAGLLMMHDRLDESHRLSQAIEGEGAHRAGDYWHGIMHRREPDYGNSRYWFRRVGLHPVFPELRGFAGTILRDCGDPAAAAWISRLSAPQGWDPMAFVDLCESATAEEESPLGLAARGIQWVEMLLLLRQTCRDAFGGIPSQQRG